MAICLTRGNRNENNLKTSGFEVLDFGCDVKAAIFVERAKEFGPHLDAVSSLLSTAQPHRREIVEDLDYADLKELMTVLVRGDLNDLEWTQSTGADGYNRDAVEVVAEARWLLGALGERP